MRVVTGLLIFLALRAISAQANELTNGLTNGLWTSELVGVDSATQKEFLAHQPSWQKLESLGQAEDVLTWLIVKQGYDSAEYQADENSRRIFFHMGKINRVQTVTFLGNRSLPAVELQKTLGIQEGTPFSASLIQEGGERIRQLYRANGFNNAALTVDVHPASTGNRNRSLQDITVQIVEGQQTLITEFRITCANTKLRARLQAVADQYLQKPFTPTNVSLLRHDLRNYLHEKHYLLADLVDPVVLSDATETQVILEIKVERPELYKLMVTGPERMTETSVRDAIGFDDFNAQSTNLPQELIQKAKQYYQSNGFARSEISLTETDGDDPYERILNLNVVEGPKVPINKLIFQGSFAKPAEYYRDFLFESGNSAFQSQYYVKDELDRTLRNLIIERKNSGYFRARILATKTVYNDARDQVDITVNMDEGPLTQIQKVSFEGSVSIGDTELLEKLGLHEQEPLRLNDLEAGLTRIQKLYRDNGFLEMRILNEKSDQEDLVSYNEDNTLAHVNLRILEGPRVVVGSIVIEGNNITRDYVIQKELEFKVGDILTPAKIDETKLRLQRMGIFTAVEIRTVEEKTNLSRRTVLISVNDRDPGIFNAGLGATNESRLTVRGFTGVAYRNIAGLARVASVRADLNYLTNLPYLEKKIAAGYLEPYLFDTRIRGRVNFTLASFVSDFNANAAIDLSQLSLGVEQQITSHFLLGWDLVNFAKYYTYSAVQDPNYAQTNTDIGSTGPTAELDYRDHPFNPTRGSLTRVATEMGLPELFSSDTIRYWRSTASFTLFTPVTTRWVWANQIRGGFLKNINNGGFVPYDKKGFILGGETTIRGFSNTEAFPNTNDLKSTSYPLTSEASMYLIKSEIRFPIKGEIGGALFYDGGQVQLLDFQLPFGYRHAAGFALRYNTPIGPVSLEMGWKLNEYGARGEGPFAVHVAIGTF